jgi:hypothetical protein
MENPESQFTKIELFFSARNLKNREILCKNHVFCIILLQDPDQHYFEVARTGIRKNTLNPNWKESVVLDFYFEKYQKIAFEVYAQGKKDFYNLGDVSTTLGDLAGQGVNILKLDPGGQLIVRVDQYASSRNVYMIELHGIKIDKKDTLGKSDPYLIISKRLPGYQWLEIHKTEVKKKH